MPSKGLQGETPAMQGHLKNSTPISTEGTFLPDLKEIDGRQAWSNDDSVTIVLDRFQEFC
jgi:hypothetical protein